MYSWRGTQIGREPHQILQKKQSDIAANGAWKRVMLQKYRHFNSLWKLLPKTVTSLVELILGL